MSPSRNWEFYSILWLSLAGLAGCASGSTSNTARTSTEQLLVANAADQALDKVNFECFSGYNVFLQDKYVDCVDKNYLIAPTRHRLYAAGAKVVDGADKADIVLELRAGALGTSSSDSFVGTPQVALPGMLAIPEVRLMERKRQEAIAKIGLVAYDPKTNEVLGEGGLSLARADDSNWFVAGVGLYKGGSVRKEVTRGTTGQAALSQGHLPTTVSFAPPIQADAPQFAAEEAAPATVSPASHKEELEPAWARKRPAQ